MKHVRSKQDLINEWVMKSKVGADIGEEIYNLLQAQKVECMVSPSGNYQVVIITPPFKNAGMEIIEQNGDKRIQVMVDYKGTKFATTFPMQEGVKMAWVNEVEAMAK